MFILCIRDQKIRWDPVFFGLLHFFWFLFLPLISNFFHSLFFSHPLSSFFFSPLFLPSSWVFGGPPTKKWNMDFFLAWPPLQMEYVSILHLPLPSPPLPWKGILTTFWPLMYVALPCKRWWQAARRWSWLECLESEGFNEPPATVLRTIWTSCCRVQSLPYQLSGSFGPLGERGTPFYFSSVGKNLNI